MLSFFPALLAEAGGRGAPFTERSSSSEEFPEHRGPRGSVAAGDPDRRLVIAPDHPDSRDNFRIGSPAENRVTSPGLVELLPIATR